MHVKGPGALAI